MLFLAMNMEYMYLPYLGKVLYNKDLGTLPREVGKYLYSSLVGK